MKTLLEYFNESMGAPLSMRNNDRFPKVKEPGTILDKQTNKYISILKNAFSKMIKDNLPGNFSSYNSKVNFEPDTKYQYNVTVMVALIDSWKHYPEDGKVNGNYFVFCNPELHEKDYNPTLFEYVKKIADAGAKANNAIKNWFKANAISFTHRWIDDEQESYDFVYMTPDDWNIFRDKLNAIAKKNNWDVAFSVTRGGIEMRANYDWNHDFKKFAEETAEHFYKCIETYFGDIAKRL